MMKRFLQTIGFHFGEGCRCAEERAEIDACSTLLWTDQRDDIRVEAFENRCCCETPRYFARISAAGEGSRWFPLCDLTLQSGDQVIALLPHAVSALWEHELASRKKEVQPPVTDRKDVFFRDRLSAVVLSEKDDEGCDFCERKQKRIEFGFTSKNGGSSHLVCIGFDEFGNLRALIDDVAGVIELHQK